MNNRQQHIHPMGAEQGAAPVEAGKEGSEVITVSLGRLKIRALIEMERNIPKGRIFYRSELPNLVFLGCYCKHEH